MQNANKLHTYRLTVKHDTGRIKIITKATTEQQAREMVCKSENCPPAAIIKTELIPEKQRAVIVTSPNGKYKACLYGIEPEKLNKLVEFRQMKGTVQKRVKIVIYTNEFDLGAKTPGVTKYKLTDQLYASEIKTYYSLD